MGYKHEEVQPVIEKVDEKEENTETTSNEKESCEVSEKNIWKIVRESFESRWILAAALCGAVIGVTVGIVQKIIM